MGRTVTHGCSVGQLKNGRAVHNWIHWDTGHLLRQLVAVIIDEEVNPPEVLLVTTNPRVQALGLLRRDTRQEQLHHFYILSDPVTELDRSGLRR